MANYGLSKDFIFKDAAKFLKSKKALSKTEYDSLAEECRSKAFTVSGYTNAGILQTFLDKLTEAVEEGTTKEAFYKSISSHLLKNGEEEIDSFRADVIFRTNIQTAFSVGHYKSMVSPKVKKLRPYWEYVTVGDGRERESHAAMAGRIYAADDPIWQLWYPPNGFRCRCMVVSRTKSYVERKGVKVSDKPPYNVDYQTGEILHAFPDKGFSNNPAINSWKPDTSSLSPAVKQVFKERQKSKR